MYERDYKAMNEKPTGYISSKPNKALCLWGHAPIDRKLLTLEIYRDLNILAANSIFKPRTYYIDISDIRWYNDFLEDKNLIDKIIDLYKEPSELIVWGADKNGTELYRFTADGRILRKGKEINIKQIK